MKPPDKAGLDVPLYGELNHLQFYISCHIPSQILGNKMLSEVFLASPQVFKEIMQLLHGFWHLEARETR